MGKKRTRKAKDDVDAFFTTEAIEEVPADDPETLKQKHGIDPEDSDEVAEIRVLARKMLRKKDREAMIDGSYNRYTFNDDKDKLPTWFVEDEAKHFTPFINASKEEIAIEKETIKSYNTRPSKKVEEAKARKNKRIGKAMAKIRTKATVIADQDLNESSKMRQIQKLYKKEKAKHKEEKSYVVNKTFKSSGNIKSGRNVKMVDARMRKDTRNDKYRKNGKGGKKGSMGKHGTKAGSNHKKGKNKAKE